MRARIALLLALTLAGGWLRFTSISFGLPDKFRPDEEFIVEHALDFKDDWTPRWAFYPAALMYLDHAVLWSCARLGGNPNIAVTGEVGVTYGRPQIDSYRYVELGDPSMLRTRNIDWILADEMSPLSFYSPGPSANELAQIESAATTMFEVNPLVDGRPQPEFDPQDAFYTPLGNIASMIRPGPWIRIWKLRPSHE